jgi:anti-sigma factor ChrR (cupin superfamily)
VTTPASGAGCENTDLVSAYALGALPPDEKALIESHLPACPACRRELESLRPMLASLAADWPAELMSPAASLRDRLSQRVGEHGAASATPVDAPSSEPRWEEVAPGISCQILATDAERERVSMLVHLGPGVAYPRHSHAGVEELHLLDGELWIEDRKLFPGDYNRAEAGTSDQCVWSETGCTCVLITSPKDVLK